MKTASRISSIQICSLGDTLQVITIVRNGRSRFRSLVCSQRVLPSNLGIMMSVMTTFGSYRLIISKPSSPLLAIMTS